MATFTVDVPDAIVGDLITALRLSLGPDGVKLTDQEVTETVVQAALLAPYRQYRLRVDTAQAAKAVADAQEAAQRAVAKARAEQDTAQVASSNRVEIDLASITVS